MLILHIGARIDQNYMVYSFKSSVDRKNYFTSYTFFIEIHTQITRPLNTVKSYIKFLVCFFYAAVEPSYNEYIKGSTNIRTGEDGRNTQGQLDFTPSYTYYNWSQTSTQSQE